METDQPTDPLLAYLDEVEVLAKAATSPPWEQDGDKYVRAVDRGGMRVGMYPHIATCARSADADYFRALPPDFAAALVRVVRAASIIADLLRDSPRDGGVDDEPEGVAYIRWSDTIAKREEERIRDALSALRQLAEERNRG